MKLFDIMYTYDMIVFCLNNHLLLFTIGLEHCT
jgi:hypothetical protein